MRASPAAPPRPHAGVTPGHARAAGPAGVPARGGEAGPSRHNGPAPLRAVPRNQLGRGGPIVPRLCFGALLTEPCACLARCRPISTGSTWGPASQRCRRLLPPRCAGCMLFGESTDFPEAEQLLGMCVDAGVDFFDTVSAPQPAPQQLSYPTAAARDCATKPHDCWCLIRPCRQRCTRYRSVRRRRDARRSSWAAGCGGAAHWPGGERKQPPSRLRPRPAFQGTPASLAQLEAAPHGCATSGWWVRRRTLQHAFTPVGASARQGGRPAGEQGHGAQRADDVDPRRASQSGCSQH
jgi:hypothetical protein